MTRERAVWTYTRFWHEGAAQPVLTVAQIMDAVEGYCPSCGQRAGLDGDGQYGVCDDCFSFFKVAPTSTGVPQVIVRVICGGVLISDEYHCLEHTFSTHYPITE